MALALLLIVLGTSCGDSDVEGEAFSNSDSSDSGFDESGSGDCEELLDVDDEFYWVSAYEVVDGELGPLCYGEEDGTLLDAWDALAALSPRGQLTDLGLFAGFDSPDEGDEVTLAFVNALDDDGNQFQMSINLPLADENEDELLVTMAHEFTHVFAATVTQMDRSADAEFECDTYYNGEACYYEDSLMWAWIEEFWDGGLIAEVDPYADATAADGEDRCSREPQFLGPYAASNPEEDFAESFAAYALDVTVGTPEAQAKLDWIDAQPGLREFRERALDAGLAPADYEFELCG